MKAQVISRVLGDSMSGEDLLHEAVQRTLSGSRNFPEDVNLEAYLVMVMKGMASDEIERRVRASERRDNAQSALHQSPVPECVLIDLAALVDQFENDDEEAALVIEEWRQGKKGPEIKADLGIDETIFNSTVRRIRRKSMRFLPDRKGRKS